METKKRTPICMTEDYWWNSQLSVARFYGYCMLMGHEYIIVNKDGIDLITLSIKAEKENKDCAIPAGEPADLVRIDFVPFYKKLKRDKFLEVLEQNRTTDDKELKKIFKELTKKKRSNEK